jgi:CBS domain containing-hemolysin-like protein
MQNAGVFDCRAMPCPRPARMRRSLISRLPILAAAVALIAWWILPAASQTTDLAGDPATSILPVSLGPDLALLLTYVVLALFFSFLCSVAEAVLLSITPSFIAELRDRSPTQAERLHQLKTVNIDRSLAAILTVNTIAHTVGAIGAGSKATAVFGDALFGVFSAVMTLLILFLSEIVPKTIGAVHWRRLTGFTDAYVRLLIFLMYPLIRVSELLTRIISHGQKVHVFSREEFIAMTDIGAQSGQIDERESKIIRNLFRFKALTAKDIMTPRTVMVALQADTTVAQAYELRDRIPFSRLPLYGRDKDEIVGFVLYEDILLAYLRNRQNDPVATLRRDLHAVPYTSPLTKLMDALMQRRQQIALVVGEFGETRGLVTMEDVVETLLGEEIMDEGDTVADMQVMARQLWVKRAKAMGIAVDEPVPEANPAAATKPGPGAPSSS